MPDLAYQSTSRVVMLKLFLTGTTTAATGKTLAIVISKAGGSFANPNAGATNATEVANGWYKATIDTTDTGTLGDLVVRGTSASCDDSERIFNVVKATNLGATGIPDAVAGANTGLPVLSSTNTLGYVILTANTLTNAPSDSSGVTTLLTRVSGTINVTNLNTLSGHDPGTTLGTSTLTQSQITGGAYSVQSASCILGDARVSNLDAAVTSRMATYVQPTGFLATSFAATVGTGTSTLTQAQVTGGAFSIGSASCILGDARIAHLTNDVPTAAQNRTDMDNNSIALAAIYSRSGVILSDLTAGVNVTALNGNSLSFDDNSQLIVTLGSVWIPSGGTAGTWPAAVDATNHNLSVNAASLANGVISSAKFTVASITGPAAGIVEMMVQLWRRFFKKTINDISNGNIKTYADDGTTVVTTQTTSSDATQQTVGPAS